jgi:hypothetical protein
LGRGFLLSRKRVAGVCLFLAIIELFKFVAYLINRLEDYF